VSLSKKDGPTEARKEVIVESKVESEAKSIEGDEAKPQEGHNQEAKEVIDSKAQCVADLKKTKHIPTIVVYRHPHHIEKQQSSRQWREHQHIMHQQGTRKETNPEVHGGLTTLQEDISSRYPIPWKHRQDAKQDQGGKETVGHHVRLPLGWMDGHTWYQLDTLLSRHIVWFLHVFRGQNM
jgi:hypothetical protein